MSNSLHLDIPAGVPWIDFTREFDAPVAAVFEAHRKHRGARRRDLVSRLRLPVLGEDHDEAAGDGLAPRRPRNDDLESGRLRHDRPVEHAGHQCGGEGKTNGPDEHATIVGWVGAHARSQRRV